MIRRTAALSTITLACAVTLSGCGIMPLSQVLTREDGWVLVSGSDTQGDFVLDDDNPLWVVFTDDHTAHGYAGCNWYDTQTTGGIGRLTFDSILMTERACVDQAPARLEVRFIDALDDITEAGLARQDLILIGPAQTLRFTRDVRTDKPEDFGEGFTTPAPERRNG